MEKEQKSQNQSQTTAPPPPPSHSDHPPPPPPQQQRPPPPFDPSRMVGIIKRKALIKQLAAEYHAECLSYCQELLELQQKSQEPFVDPKNPNGSKRDTIKPSKRAKKTR